MEIDFLIVLVIMYYRAILKTGLAGFARVCRDSLGFKRTLFNYLLRGGTVKNFICVFALVAMVGLAGCAGLGKKGGSVGGPAGGSAGESQLGKGAFQKMSVTCWGFCSIDKGNSK